MLYGQQGTSYEARRKEDEAYEDSNYLKENNFMSNRQVRELDSLKESTEKYNVNFLYSFLYDYDRKNNGDLTHNQRYEKVVGIIKQIIKQDKCSLEINLYDFLLNKNFKDLPN